MAVATDLNLKARFVACARNEQIKLSHTGVQIDLENLCLPSLTWQSMSDDGDTGEKSCGASKLPT